MSRTFVLGCVLSSSAASAEPAWHLDAGLVTEMPLSAGTYLQAELPSRLRFRLGIGWMPTTYLGWVNDISVNAGWYNETTAALIEASLSNALVIHPSIGWRPLDGSGLYVGAGYQIAALGGSLTGLEVVELALGESSWRQDADAALEVQASAADHMLTINMGWDIVFNDVWVVDVGLGGAFTVGARARLEEKFRTERPAVSGAIDPLLERGETYLVDTLKSYVHTPLVRIGVAYRFQ